MAEEATTGRMIGHYRVGAQAGKGGTASVFLAEHSQTGERVALKVFSPRDLAVAEFRRRVRREVQTLKQCSHPNILRILDFDLDGPVPHLAFEYYEGEHLGMLVKREGALPPERITRIALDVAAALEHCHALELFHRDIKPANIMLESKTGRAILVDFGLVKAANATTITTFGGIMGSLGYLAPEQILGQPVDGRTDIYQLGMVLFKLATGKEPLEMDAEEKLIEARSLAQIAQLRMVPTVRSQVPDFPEELDRIVSGCVQLDPARRPPAAGALVRALRAFSSSAGYA